LTYTKKKRDLEEFERRTVGKMKIRVKKNRAQTLQEFVTEKKVRMLTDHSKYSSE
jgi:hypothetical protein